MDKLFNRMEEYAAINKVPIIDRESLKLLIETVQIQKPARVLEIGTAIGYSALYIAGQLPPGGSIISIEIDQERAETARSFISQSELADRIDIIVGDAAEVLSQLNGSFDLLFIDAAKGQYLKYLLLVLEKLSPGAVIIADNVLFRGFVRSADRPPRRFKTIVERLREYLNFVCFDNGFSTVVYSVGDGIAVSKYQEEKKDEKN